MAKLSVSRIPVAFSTSSRSQSVALLGVVGAGGIAGGGTDAAVFLVDQVVGRERLVAAVAPFPPGLLVQHLGERLGQAVGQGLGHDRVVIVAVPLELARPVRRRRSRSSRRRRRGSRPGPIDRSDVVGQAAKAVCPSRSHCWRSIGNRGLLASTASRRS